MATIRVQLTTYLSTEEQLTEWDAVKTHFGEASPDAAVLRELIHNKFMDIKHGKTRRQSIERIEEDIRGLKEEQIRQRDVLEKIAAKVGIDEQQVYQSVTAARAVGCDSVENFDDDGMEIV